MSTSTHSDISALSRHSEYRSGFEQLLTSLSTRFINLPIEAIDGGIVAALSKIGQFTGVDRCFVYQYVDEAKAIGRMTHEWCAPGAPSIQHRVQHLDLEPLSWAVDQLAAGKVIHVSDSRELPEQAAALRELYDSLGVRSAVYLPLSFKSEARGMLGFSCINQKKVWSEDSINLLRVVGEIVVNAVDRKNDYLQLKVSKERYESVIEDQTDLIVRWKPDGTQTFVNDAACRFLNLSREEALQLNVFDPIHPDDVQAVRHKIASLTVDQPSITDEHRVIRRDGSLAWLEWSDRALFDESGNVIELQSVGRDVTAQKQAREELEYRRELERLILGITSRFIHLPPGQLEQEIVDALQLVAEFVGGQRSYIFLFDESRTTASLSLEWVAEGCPETPAHLKLIPNLERDWSMQLLEQGQPISISNLDALPPNAMPLRNEFSKIDVASFILVPIFLNEQLIGFMGISSRHPGERWTPESASILQLVGEVFANALMRKSAEQALAASEERLRLTIDAVADGFHDWNIASSQIYVSDHWLASRNLPAGSKQWTVKDWQASIHPDDQSEVMERLADHFDGKTEVFECEYRWKARDDNWQWILTRGRVIERTSNGDAVRMVGVDRDITEQVTSRQRLREAEEHLVHLARVATMGEVVAGIAHEVNQPLHAAATFATALGTALESGEEEGRDRAVQIAGKISGQINRAADIIRRLREFTRPQRVNMARFDLNNVVRETAEMLAFEAQRKRIRVELDLYEPLPGVIGDRVQIQQVVVNLLRNAFEAIDIDDDGSPRVIVRTKLEESRARLDIEDNGPGIEPGRELEQLFNAFVTTKDDGMGMGLALCRTIVARHHGKIWGDSNQAGGMTFSLLLPVEPEKRSG